MMGNNSSALALNWSVPLLAEHLVEDFIEAASRPRLKTAGSRLLKYHLAFTHGLVVKLESDIP